MTKKNKKTKPRVPKLCINHCHTHCGSMLTCDFRNDDVIGSCSQHESMHTYSYVNDIVALFLLFIVAAHLASILSFYSDCYEMGFFFSLHFLPMIEMKNGFSDKSKLAKLTSILLLLLHLAFYFSFCVSKCCKANSNSSICSMHSSNSLCLMWNIQNAHRACTVAVHFINSSRTSIASL